MRQEHIKQTLFFDNPAWMFHYFRMTILRRNRVFVLAWILFWTLQVYVAVLDFIRNEHSDAL